MDGELDVDLVVRQVLLALLEVCLAVSESSGGEEAEGQSQPDELGRSR